MPSRAVDLTRGPVRTHLVRQTTPMLFGIAAMMSFSLVDTWFVALLGEDSLAAMSFTIPVVLTLTSLGIGLMAGTSSVIARQFGQRNLERVRVLATDALLITGALAVVGTVAGVLSIEPLFGLLGATPELLPLIHDYMFVWYLGFVIFLVPMTGTGVIRGAGDAKLQSMAIIVGAVLNLILDPLLIFGLFGFPRLELEGAALASVISRFATLLFGYWVLAYKMRLLTRARPSWHRLVDSWKAVMHVGAPAAGTNMIIPLSTGVVVAMLAEHGAHAVAGFGAATRIEGVVLVVFYAMSSIIGPFMGQNLGAGHIDRIRRAMTESAVFCVALGLVIAGLLALLAVPLMRLFADDAAVITVGVLYLMIVPWSYAGNGVVMVANAAFNGLGRPGPAVIISSLRVVIVYLPLAYLGGRWFGVEGVFGALLVSNLATGVLAYRWHQRTCHRGAPETT